MKRLVIVTDAFAPQVNGVVKTLETTIDILKQWGWDVTVIYPSLFKTFSLPIYKEIQIAYNFSTQLKQILKEANPQYIHIATEGTLGWAARKYCIENKLNFTTAYHTKFPEFINRILHIPLNWVYYFIRKFHNASSRVFVASQELGNLLTENNFTSEMAIWSRGIDCTKFSPSFKKLTKVPYALYVGRISHEKQIEKFLECKTDLLKVVVGDGPQLKHLKLKYPEVLFTGVKHGSELSQYFANAEVFVFPSITDTFGLVLIEALASGTPVAAYPVENCKNIITDEVGCLSEDLSQAIEVARTKSRTECVQYAQVNFNWHQCTNQFIKNLVKVQ